MSTVTCHNHGCAAYGYPREMLLASTVVDADGNENRIWESGVYCSCGRKLRDVQHGPIAVGAPPP